MAGEMRLITLLDAPSNLGLNPPTYGSIPGCYKLGWALREAGLLEGLQVEEAGVVIPPRYEAVWRRGDGDRHAEAIADYSQRLADRLEPLISTSRLLVLLGGDCSIQIGISLALRRRGRHGVVFVDGHSDFRHPFNSDRIGAAAGEDLAIITGRGDPRLINIAGLKPYIRDEDVVAVGMRTVDEDLPELAEIGIPVWTIGRLRDTGIAEAASHVIGKMNRPELDGYWVHVDVDVVDGDLLPAVDSPAPDGLGYDEFSELLAALVGQERCLGLNVGIFDPDLDPTGIHAVRLVKALRPVLEVHP